MSFKDYVFTQDEYAELNDLQKSVVEFVNKQTQLEVIAYVLGGRKACPYRIVQTLWQRYQFSKAAEISMSNELSHP